MKLIDISIALNEKTVVWKADPQPELKPICRMPEAPCNFTWLNFSAHAGTHVDAPYYLFPDKWRAEEIPLSRLIGPCQVLDLTRAGASISRADLEREQIDCPRLLLKTVNSYDDSGRYNPEHAELQIEAAHYLIERGVETLGFDYQSFERNGANDLHRVFLERSITLIDNLNLREVASGSYYLLCLPLKVTGIDAAPARAVLVEGLL